MYRSSEQMVGWDQKKVLWPSLVVLFLFGPGAALAPGYFTKMLQNMASHTAKPQKNPAVRTFASEALAEVLKLELFANVPIK